MVKQITLCAQLKSILPPKKFKLGIDQTSTKLKKSVTNATTTFLISMFKAATIVHTKVSLP